jgi:DUF971 family protein
MSADSFTIYYGLRYTITERSEIRLLEQQQHQKTQAARLVGLDSIWGVTEDESTYYLLIGRELGIFGWEYLSDREIGNEELDRIMKETKIKLQKAGFERQPALIFQFHPDF